MKPVFEILGLSNPSWLLIRCVMSTATAVFERTPPVQRVTEFLQIGLNRVVRVGIVICGNLINRTVVWWGVLGPWRRAAFPFPQPDMPKYCFDDFRLVYEAYYLHCPLAFRTGKRIKINLPAGFSQYCHFRYWGETFLSDVNLLDIEKEDDKKSAYSWRFSSEYPNLFIWYSIA